MKRLTLGVGGVLFVEFGRVGFAVRFGTFGFGEAIDSRSRRTEVPWNPMGAGVSCSTSSAYACLVVPVSVRLSSDLATWMACAREASIGGCIFATSSSKNLHLRLTSRLLLKGPRIFASDDSGSARLGRLGGFCSCFCVRGDPRRAKVDPSSAVISGEYTGGREDSTGGMIGGGSGADGSLRRGWRKLDLVGWA